MGNKPEEILVKVETDIGHKYLKGNNSVPGVTTILHALGAYDNFSFSEQKARKGSMVHKAIELHCNGTLDYNSIDFMTKQYIKAWDDMIKDYELTTLESEIMIDGKGYAGTADSTFLNKKLQIGLGEIKSSMYFSKAYPLQIAAYAKTIPGVQFAYLILLSPGKYKVIIYNKLQLAYYYAIFRSCLTVYNYFHKSKEAKNEFINN